MGFLKVKMINDIQYSISIFIMIEYRSRVWKIILRYIPNNVNS